MPVIKNSTSSTASSLPSLRMFCIPAMAETSETKIIGTTTQYSRFKKMFAQGVSTLAPGPQNAPTMPPSTMQPNRMNEDLYELQIFFTKIPPSQNFPRLRAGLPGGRGQ